MSYYMAKSYSYSGPGFEIIEPAPVRRNLNFLGASSSRPLKPEFAPRVARQLKPHKGSIGDITLVNGPVAVSGRFRDLVERFEPGIHLFVPMELQRSDGSPIEGDWFFFSAQQDIDCILTKNDPSWFSLKADGVDWFASLAGFTPNLGEDLFLSRPQIEGKHLWTGGLLGYNELFFSDEFHAAFEAGDFDYLNSQRRCIDVERPWIAEENMGPMLGKWRNYVAHGRDLERDMA